MHVVISSLNPVKVSATEDAFKAAMPGQTWQFHACAVPSGVAEQPRSDEETWQGAKNRAQAAAQQKPDAHYWLGLEGGIDTLHGQLSTFAWIYIRRHDGQVSQSRSGSLALPRSVIRLIDDGLELGHACDKVFNTENVKQKAGAIGLLTNNLYTRRSTYAQSVCFALAGFQAGD